MPLTNVSYINKGTSVKKGTTVSILGRIAGGAKPCKYEFYFKRSANSKWNSITASGDTFAKFTPTAVCSFDLKVVATDSKGAKAEKIITIDSVS